MAFEYEEVHFEDGTIQLNLTQIKKIADAPPKTGIDLLPFTKDFTIRQADGSEWTEIGRLVKTEAFAFYMIEGMSYDLASNTMTLDLDNGYSATIDNLPHGYDLQDIKKDAGKKLAQVGKVREVPAAEMNPMMGGAVIMFTADNDKMKLTQQMIVKEVDGRVYRIHINIPHSEYRESFANRIYATLGTLVNQPADG